MEGPVHVTGRLSAILKAVAATEPDGCTTSALSREVHLSRSTVHRLLTALQDEGLIDRDQATGHWLLGPELYLLGQTAQPRYDVTHIAQPHIRRLAETTGESAFFSARRGEETICLLREDGSFPIRSHVLYVGIRFPLGVASAGLVILAHLPDREINDYLKHTDLTHTYGRQHTAASIRHRITQTRANGYALNPGLLVEGSWGLGAAVFDHQQRPAWALSLTGIEQRFNPDRIPELGGLLLHTAHQLTQAIAATRGAP